MKKTNKKEIGNKSFYTIDFIGEITKEKNKTENEM